VEPAPLATTTLLTALISLASGIAGSLIGGCAVYYVGRLNKLREVRIQFLIDAYHRLEKVSRLETLDGELAKTFFVRFEHRPPIDGT
jgi:hypothetical protein